MAITINTTPATVDFCLNKPIYKVTGSISPVKLVARVYIEEEYGSAVYTQLSDIYHDPDSTQSSIFYIGKYLEEYFETLKINLFSLTQIEQDLYSLKKYYINFYEWDGSSLGTAEQSATRYILFGKLSYQDWPGHTFMTTLTANKDYLNNAGAKFRIWKTAKQYLSWLNHVIGTNNIELRVTIYYTDKTSEDQTIDTFSNSVQYDVLTVPAGYEQLGIGVFNTNKTVYKYTLGLYLSTNTQVGKTISYYLQNKPWWAQQFLFRNNYGVLEALIAEGKESSEVKADFEISKSRTPHDYAAPDFEFKQRVKSRTKEYKTYIGPLTQTEAEHLEEILNNRLFKFGSTKLIPCNILSKSIKPYDQKEDLQAIELKYQYAFEI